MMHKKIVAINVNSGVSDQPMDDKETFSGALNRAKAARVKLGADFGVGIEGGLNIQPHGIFSNAWVVVVDRKGNVGTR